MPFYCPKCQKEINDYNSHCIHFPKREKKMECPQILKDIFNL